MSIQDQLAKLQKKSNGAISLSDAFNDEFIKEHTKFKTTREFFQNSELKINSQNDFDKLSDDVLEKFVQENSEFGSWSEMVKTAVIPIINDRIKGKMHTPKTDNSDEFLNITITPNITLG